MAATTTCENEYSSISEFLQLADLLTFKEKFVRSGVTKAQHLEDVEEEDLKEFGTIFAILNVCLHCIYLNYY